MGIAVPFPETLPAGYEWLDEEPTFDPAWHLQLESPVEIVMLADLGYSEHEIATKATPVAVSSPFRRPSHCWLRLHLEISLTSGTGELARPQVGFADQDSFQVLPFRRMAAD